MPRSNQQHINRYRFAYCTVHTSWANSVDQYNAIKRTNADTTYKSLLRMLKNSQGGMYQIKATGINHLQSLWTTTEDVQPRHQDNWQSWRTKLSNNLKKLGLAKTSFAIEMIRPLDAQIICIDRHMFKAFGWENVDYACSYNSTNTTKITGMNSAIITTSHPLSHATCSGMTYKNNQTLCTGQNT